MTKNGYSFVELIVSFIILSIVMLAAAEFTASTFQTSYNHSFQVRRANNDRFSTERIFSQISIADYIYPANTALTFQVGSNNIQINTNTAIAYLLNDGTSLTSPKYFFKAFYLVDKNNNLADLYEFTSQTAYSWSVNSLPSISQPSGSSSKIASNINKNDTSLSYILNYESGATDSILTGQLAGSSTSSTYALIKGIDLKLIVEENNKRTIEIKEMSNNVPRFIE